MAQYKYLIQRFIGGMNSDLDPAAVDLTKQQDQVVEIISSVYNGAFERGTLISRPQLEPVTVGNVIGADNNIIAVSALPFPSNGSVSTYRIGGMVLTFNTTSSTYKLWKLNAEQVIGVLFDAVEITGPGITASGWDNFYFSNCVCNGVVLIAGYKGGLIRWDPTTTVYTIIANAKFAFVAKQNSRAVAAYKTAGGLNDPLIVAASKSGDETVWVPASIEAYENTVADIDDAITGIGVAKGVLVVARTFGFHLGYPTGTFPAIYNFTQHSSNAIGCSNPATFCIYKNVCYFVSTNGIHTFDLVDVEDIGEGVYTEILGMLNQLGGTLRGFISASYKADFQPTYNLYLDNTGGTSVPRDLPLWQFNIRERKWCRWFSGPATPPVGEDSPMWFPFYYRGQAPTGRAIPITSSISHVTRKVAVQSTWGFTKNIFGNGLENNALLFSTGQLTISAPVFEATISRVLLVYKAAANIADGPQIGVVITSILNGVQTQKLANVTPIYSPAGGVPSTWVRQWVGNLFCVGQMFQIAINMAGINYCVIKELVVEFTDTSKERA